MTSTSSDQTKIICNKHDIYLKTTDIKNVYTLDFSISNSKIDLNQFLGWKIYELLYELNKDILCDMKQFSTNKNNNNIQMYYLFKRFGKDLGILQRYMFFNIEKIDHSNDSVEFRSTLIQDDAYSTKLCQPLKSNFSIFNIKKINDKLHIKYIYHIDLEEQLPASMKNIAGILIKKLFWRVKTFIEKL